MKFVEQTKASLDEQKFISLASKGYGVPLLSEMKSAQALGVELELTRTNAVNLDKVLKEYFPEITTELDHIGKNIKKFNLDLGILKKISKELSLEKKYDQYLNKNYNIKINWSLSIFIF